MFPYHQVPDGSVALPHHLTWALILTLVPLWILSNGTQRRQPVLTLTAVVVALVAFVLVWPTHHALGAALSVAATATAALVLAARLLLALRADDPDWPPLPLAIALLLTLIALDDVLHHAFGWPMPLDWVWKTHLRPRLPSH